MASDEAKDFVSYLKLVKLYTAMTSSKMNSKNIKHILDQDGDINYKVPNTGLIKAQGSDFAGCVILHLVCRRCRGKELKDMQFLDLLLDRGVDITSKDSEGRTAIHDVINKMTSNSDSSTKLHDNPPLQYVDRLLSAHLKFRITANPVDPNGLSHFHAACITNNVEAIEFFLNNGVSIDQSVNADSPIFAGYTALNFATKYACSDAVKLLSHRGAKVVEVQDAKKMTPSHVRDQTHCVRDVHLLLKCHQGTSNPVDEDGLSYLHIACAAEKKDVVEALLTNGADVNGKLEKTFVWGSGYGRLYFCRGSSPLHIAAATRNREMAKLLLQRGADLQARDANGWTAVHRLIVTNLNWYDVGRELLSSQNLCECVVDSCGLSHLHVACLAGHPNAVTKLLGLGARVDRVINCSKAVTGERRVDACRDSYGDPSLEPSSALLPFDGFAPLHFAIEPRDNARTLKLLLQHGADVLVASSAGTVPLFSVMFCDKDHHQHYWRTFAAALKRDDKLRRRVERVCGSTDLHVACDKRDVPRVQKLLADGADVNARIREDSSFLPGRTALHVLMRNGACGRHASETILKLLLSHGADVAVSDGQFTPLHLALMRSGSLNDLTLKLQCDSVTWMISSISDFSRNPTTHQGVSHFHIACNYLDVDAVEGFLKHGVDVNAKIDYFSEYYAGYTPLHVALIRKDKEDERIDYFSNCNPGCTPALLFEGDSPAKVKIVELLLKHGADVRAEDAFGNTPLHCAANNSAGEQIFRMIFDAGADINVANVNGASALELLLSETKHIQIETLSYFIERGCRINSFNSITEEGRIPYIILGALSKDSFEDLRKLILSLPNIIELDEMGRSIIHNIVSPPLHHWWTYSCCNFIEELEKWGCDVDHQDSLGRTALHTSVQFENDDGISSLLAAGADINIIDGEGKTAYSYALDPDRKFNFSSRIICDPAKLFTTHVYKLQFAGIHVSALNERLKEIQLEKPDDYPSTMDKKHFHTALNGMEKTKIGSLSLTLAEAISETGDLRKYSKMTRDDRDAVAEYFESILNAKDRKLSALRGIVKRQYRNLVTRPKLMEDAKLALDTLSNVPLPDLCSEAIFARFENWELRSVIEAGK